MIRVIRGSDELHHKTAPTFDSCADRGFSAHKGFFNIAGARHVSRRALSITKLKRARLGVQSALHQLCQPIRRSREDGVTKGIQTGLVGADLFSVFAL